MRLHTHQPGLRRHTLLSTALGAVLSLAVGLSVVMASNRGLIPALGAAQPSTNTAATSCLTAAVSPNPIAAENQCQGTTAWRLDHPLGPDNAIEAFTAPASVNAGQLVKIFVSTPAAAYSVQVFRMGWYQGLGAHLVYSSSRLPGIVQPAPTINPSTRTVSCDNWRDPVALQVPYTWVSGVYVVKLVSSAGYMRYTSFVVRNDSANASILFQTSVLTYQAYNTWGGYSLYGALDAQHKLIFQSRAYAVSFDRPYAGNAGLGDFVRWELPLLRWVERQGYDLSYTTDVDTDMSASSLLHRRLIVIAGHDEYWSTLMRTHMTAARDAGVSLAFIGANDVYWHVRLQNSPLGPDRVVTCYKDALRDPVYATDPQAVTVYWQSGPLHLSEDELVGEMDGGQTVVSSPLVLNAAAGQFLLGTSLHAGSAVPGLVGGEVDTVRNDVSQPTSLVVLASSPVSCNGCAPGDHGMANATLYTAKSGARVFDAGTFQWSWGLDNERFDPQLAPRSDSNPDFQKFTANLLSYLLR